MHSRHRFIRRQIQLHLAHFVAATNYDLVMLQHHSVDLAALFDLHLDH